MGSIDSTVPRIVSPGEGRVINFPGLKGEILLGATQTSGQFMISTITVEPGSGPSMHQHEFEDEVYVLLDGEVEFKVGDKVQRAGPGTAVWLPRRLPHGWKVVGDVPATLVNVLTGGNFEEFLMASASAIASGDRTKVNELSKLHGVRYLD